MRKESKKMNEKMLKKLALKSGVDLWGIAPVERFRAAPEGFMNQSGITVSGTGNKVF